ncbi:MAG: shikimate dehydrogenase [Hyphomicrobiaceae bacterium]
MKRACIIGWPVEHSRSPMIHGHWIKQYGIAGEYVKRAVKPEDVRTFLHALADEGFAGCNVTVPNKQQAYAAAGWLDPSAKAVGAANTIWLDNGVVCAANSDTYGYIAHLDATAPQWRQLDGPVTVLGAGGTARALTFGFLDAGISEVRIVARTLARGEEIARHFGRGVKVVGWDARDAAAAGSRLIVNTTTLGMKGAGSPEIDLARCRSTTVVSDVVYIPLETPFLAAARTRGLATVDGLGMLLHQAVPGFEKWFGVRPEVTPELRDILVRDIEGA